MDVATPDSDLLAAARAGDPAAVDALMVRHAPAVLRFVRRMCDNPEDADEVAQETLLAAARGLGDLRGDGALTTWLYTVARRGCTKKRRRSVHAPDHLVPLHDVSPATGDVAPDEAAAGREIGGALQQALRSLDPKYREVLLLRDVEGLTGPEVAAVLGIGLDAVKSRLHRARTAVRERLEPMVALSPAASCPDVVTLFSRHLEGDIGADECAAMERHVAECASCNAACASLERSVARCRHAGADVPADVQERVRAALRGVVGRN